MKIETENEVIYGNSKTQKKAFSIASSSKAFKILSSNIYKNKIRAVVRELSCNCLDAHKLNGNTRPFELTAPTWLDQHFVVRDFGPGLSDEDIMNLYTTYFASTKDQSNDFIGALGLGSKSPFSYTDIFTVKSHFNGICTTYTASMVNGEPNIAKVVENPSSEPSGLEIVIPTKSSDQSRWEEEIEYVLFPFPRDTYVVKGGLTIDSYLPDEFFVNGYYEKDNSRYNYDRLFAVYGNILYPLSDCPGIDEVTHWIQTKGKVLYVKFDLGTLDIQPSREELSYDETTISNIIDKISKFDEELREVDIQRYVDMISESGNIESYYSIADEFRRDSLAILRKDIRLAGMFDDGDVLVANANAFFNKYSYTSIKDYKKDRPSEHPISGYLVSGSPLKSLPVSNYQGGIRLREVRSTILFVNVDCSKTIPKVLKKCTNLESAIPDINKFDSILVAKEIEKSEIYRDMLAVHPDIKITVMNMTDIHKVAEFEEEVSKEERRPKSPNGYRLKKDDQGKYYEWENLYLTAKEVREYSGYYIVSYDSSYGTVDPAVADKDNKLTNYSLFRSKTLSRYCLTNYLDGMPDEYTIFLPSVWKYLDFDNIKDVYEEISSSVTAILDKASNLDKLFKKKEATTWSASSAGDSILGWMVERIEAKLGDYTETWPELDYIFENSNSYGALVKGYTGVTDNPITELLVEANNNTQEMQEIVEEHYGVFAGLLKIGSAYTRDNLEDFKKVIEIVC